MNHIYRLLLLLWLITTPIVATAVTIEIEGLTAELKQNLILHIGDVKALELGQPIRLSRMLDQATHQALQPFGYYHTEVTSTVDGETLRLNIKLGPRVVISETDISISGEASTLDEFQTLLKESSVRVGQPLNHRAYDTLREDLLDLCRDMGFFDAAYSKSELIVNPEENSARPVLHLDSGPRYRFGELVTEGSELDPFLLTSIAKFHSGEPFVARQVKQLERHLQDTNYFQSVQVRTEPRDGAIVDIKVALEDVNTTRYEIGVGFSTDTRFRIRLNHINPRVNDAGHSIESALKLSQPEQSLEGTYRIPLANPLNNFLLINGGVQHKEVKDTTSTSISTGARKVTQLGNLWNWSYGISTEYEKYTVGQETQKKVFYLMPGSSISKTRLQRGFDPLSGSNYWFSAEFSTPALGAESDFIRLRSATKWLFNLGDDNTTLLTRLELGAILTEELTRIPASLRFYTGGDGSIRGYDYQSLSPLDENGDLTGGQYLAVGSVEISHRIMPQWRIAAFLDGGSAFNDASDTVHQSAGVGVRWLSPLGQIRFDIATPIADSGHSGIKIHISMGPPL